MSFQRCIAALAVLLLSAPSGHAAAVSSYAYINFDGSLRIKGRTYRLYGLFIPPSVYVCQQFTLPPTCSSQVAIALDFKIGANFVRCDAVAHNEDGTQSAFCSVAGEDLGAYLIREGWAMVLPGAPPEYVMYERLAQARGFGIWVNQWSIFRYPY